MSDKSTIREKAKLNEYWFKENLLQRSRGYFYYASAMMLEERFKDYPLQDKVVVDVGCGMGKQLLWFKDKGAKTYGIDLDHKINRVANKQNALSIVTGDARILPFKTNSVDVIYSLGVLEHFLETEKAVAEQLRVLRPGGIIVMVVPYLTTPYALAISLFEILRGAYFKFGFLITRGRLFSRRQIKDMFEACGCEKISIQPYYGSAFLRILPFVVRNTGLISKIEKSILSRKFGLVLYAQAAKKASQ